MGEVGVAAYQAERRQLQSDYQQRPDFKAHLHHTADSDLALDLAVERMDDKLDALRKGFRRWQALVLTLIGMTIGGIWWVKQQGHSDSTAVQQGVKEIIAGQKEIIAGPKITTAGIRKQILLGSERKRDRDLAEADAAEPAKREKLREAALAAHTFRISRIDELAQSFTELEGRADTTNIFKEMARILEQEGVDMALAYIAEQKGGILDRVKKRKKTEQAQTRTELQPLLTAADLKASSGQTVAARAAYRELLALDPAWPAALESVAQFLYDQTIQNNHHGTLIAALRDAEEGHMYATQLYNANPGNAKAQLLLCVAHEQMGYVLFKRGQDGDSAEVEAHFTRSLGIAEMLVKANPSVDAQLGMSAALNTMGHFFATRGQVGDLDKALDYITRSFGVSEKLLKANPGSKLAKRGIACCLDGMGELLAKRGRPGDEAKALNYVARSLDLREALLKARPSPEATRDVSISLRNLGGLLVERGHPGDSAEALGYCIRSLSMTEALLKENPDSAEAMEDVSESLEKIGVLLGKRGEAGDATKALMHVTRSLALRESLLKANPSSGEAIRAVSLSLMQRGKLLEKRGETDDALKALDHFTRSLVLNEAQLKANPNSAKATRDVSDSLNELGEFLARRGQAGDEDTAARYFTRSLDMTEALLKANQDSAEATQDVSESLIKLGTLLATRGQPGDADKAVEYFTRSLVLRDALLKANPDSATATRYLWESLINLGDFLATRGQPGDADKAVGHFIRSLDMAEVLLKANPDSAEETRIVSISLTTLGDFFAQRGQVGDLDKGVGYLTRGLNVTEALLKTNPGSAQATRDVSVSLEKLAIALSKRNQPTDFARATHYFDRCVMNVRALLRANPETGEALSDLADVYMEYATHVERVRKGDGLPWWRLTDDILRRKVQKGMSLSPDDQKFIKEVSSKLTNN